MTTSYEEPSYLKERLRLPDPMFLLDYYLKEKRARFENWEQSPEDRTWRASSLGSCLRAQTLSRRGVEETRLMDAKTYRTFAWGDEVHGFVRKIFWRLGLVVAEEPTFTDPALDVTGHVDLIWNPAGTFRKPGDSPPSLPGWWTDEWRTFLGDLRDGVQQEFAHLYAGHAPDMLVGMELKSAHSFAMKRIFNEGPYEHHQVQAGIYKHMALMMPGALTDEKSGVTWRPQEVDRWFITYVGKDAVGLLNYEVEDAWVDEAVERAVALNTYWDAGTIPPCDCQGWQVGYCAYTEGKESCCGRDQRGLVAKAIRDGL